MTFSRTNAHSHPRDIITIYYYYDNDHRRLPLLMERKICLGVSGSPYRYLIHICIVRYRYPDDVVVGRPELMHGRKVTKRATKEGSSLQNEDDDNTIIVYFRPTHL